MRCEGFKHRTELNQTFGCIWRQKVSILKKEPAASSQEPGVRIQNPVHEAPKARPPTLSPQCGRISRSLTVKGPTLRVSEFWLLAPGSWLLTYGDLDDTNRSRFDRGVRNRT